MGHSKSHWGNTIQTNLGDNTNTGAIAAGNATKTPGLMVSKFLRPNETTAGMSGYLGDSSSAPPGSRSRPPPPPPPSPTATRRPPRPRAS